MACCRPEPVLTYPSAFTWRQCSLYDDVIKWKHFPRYWPFVRGIHRSPVNSPLKGQWRWAMMFSLICAWIDGCVNNHEAGDLRRHRAHCDVIVMGNSEHIIHWICFELTYLKSQSHFPWDNELTIWVCNVTNNAENRASAIREIFIMTKASQFVYGDSKCLRTWQAIQRKTLYHDQNITVHLQFKPESWYILSCDSYRYFWQVQSMHKIIFILDLGPVNIFTQTTNKEPCVA